VKLLRKSKNDLGPSRKMPRVHQWQRRESGRPHKTRCVTSSTWPPHDVIMTTSCHVTLTAMWIRLYPVCVDRQRSFLTDVDSVGVKKMKPSLGDKSPNLNHWHNGSGDPNTQTYKEKRLWEKLKDSQGRKDNHTDKERQRGGGCYTAGGGCTPNAVRGRDSGTVQRSTQSLDGYRSLTRRR
jgi:hypothetical protein